MNIPQAQSDTPAFQALITQPGSDGLRQHPQHQPRFSMRMQIMDRRDAVAHGFDRNRLAGQRDFADILAQREPVQHLPDLAEIAAHELPVAAGQIADRRNPPGFQLLLRRRSDIKQLTH